MESFLAVLADVAAFAGKSMLKIAPFLLVSVPLTIYLRRSGASERIKGTLNRGPLAAVLGATIFGALSPLCSCGVIPVVAALLAGGVPLAPVMAFWLASPSMDPEILVLSAGTVGWELALWRLGATFLMSFGGGMATAALERRAYFSGGVLRLVPAAAPAPAAAERTSCASGADSGACACASSAPAPSCGPACRAGSALSPLLREAGRTLAQIGGFMALAFVLEALVIRFVPMDAVAALLGRKSPLAVPLATALGIPLYTTNLSALGVVSGLLTQGMDPAAALAFFVGGAVTTVPAMSAVFGIVKSKVFALYLLFAFGGSLLAGYAWKAAHLVG